MNKSLWSNFNVCIICHTGVAVVWESLYAFLFGWAFAGLGLGQVTKRNVRPSGPDEVKA